MKTTIRKELYHYYNVDNAEDLIVACAKDWRFCIPETIAIDGFIPRTPYVKLNSDLNWRPIQDIEKLLIDVVKKRRNTPTRRNH